MTKPFNWKLFFILLAASLFGTLAIIPYATGLTAGVAQPQAITWRLVALGLIQAAILNSLVVAIGLWCANRTGLGLPILEAALRGEAVGERVRAMLPLSIGLGAVAGLLIIGLEAAVFQPAMLAEYGDPAEAFAAAARQPAWKAFLASFYGGINEELLLRLFLMSLLAWLGRFISRTADGGPTMAVLWIANIVSAVLFGLGHLPTTATIVPLTPLIVTRALVLNGIGGLIFGWLYMKRGLESAMLSHFSAGIVLHVIFGI